ncbi:hypothetical protein V491_04945, partial [Pseudogymnoascus sp. VKM F-3775]
MASLANPGRAAARPVARVLMMRDHSLEMWCSVETIAFILVGMAGRRLAGSGLMAPTGTPRLRQCLGELQRWNGYWPVGLGFGLLLFRRSKKRDRRPLLLARSHRHPSPNIPNSSASASRRTTTPNLTAPPPLFTTAMATTPSVACIGIIGKANNPLHISIFPTCPPQTPGGFPEPLLTPLQTSLLLSSTLDIFEARARANALNGQGLSSDYGLLKNVDERLA